MGHRELDARVTDAYERFIASGEYDFRRRDDAERLRDVVEFRWEMVSTEGGVGFSSARFGACPG